MVRALRKKEDKSELSFIVAAAIEQTQLLEEWRVTQVKRECNLVANELALLARRNTHTAVWLGQAPACILDLVKDDCNLCPPS